MKQQPSPSRLVQTPGRPNLALSSTIEKLKGQLLSRPITVTHSKDSLSPMSPGQMPTPLPRPPSPPDPDDVEVVAIVRTPSPRKVLEVVSPGKQSVADRLPRGITVTKSPVKFSPSKPKNGLGVFSLGQEEASDTTQPQRILDLLLSTGLTPHQPISILQRVARPVSDQQARSTVQLILGQVSQMRNIQSQLSVTHKQVLNLSPPLRRPSVDLLPSSTSSQESQNLSTLLNLLDRLPKAQLTYLEDQLNTTTQHAVVSPEKLLTHSNPDKYTISTLEELSPTPLPPGRPSIPPPNRRHPLPPSAKYKSGSAGGGWRVWTGELGQEGAAWQLTVNPPKGQGQSKTFEVEKSYLRELGLDNTRTKNLRTTDAEESDEEVKLYFGSKFLSVPKSVFHEEEGMNGEEERISHLLE